MQKIAPDVVLGKGVKVYDFVNLYGCRIGDNTRIGTFVEIQKGASVLASKLRYLRYRAAQACLLDSAPVAPDLLRAAVAAYNCGEGRVAKLIAQGRDVDSLTTGRDYSRDVLERARYYAAHGYPWPGEGGTDDAPTT